MEARKFLEIVLAFEFPLHSQSAFNPSVFTIKKFKENEIDRKNLKTGLNITLFLNLVFSFALYLTNKTAGIIAFVVSIAIYIYYLSLIEERK